MKPKGRCKSCGAIVDMKIHFRGTIPGDIRTCWSVNCECGSKYSTDDNGKIVDWPEEANGRLRAIRRAICNT